MLNKTNPSSFSNVVWESLLQGFWLFLKELWLMSLTGWYLLWFIIKHTVFMYLWCVCSRIFWWMSCAGSFLRIRPSTALQDASIEWSAWGVPGRAGPTRLLYSAARREWPLKHCVCVCVCVRAVLTDSAHDHHSWVWYTTTFTEHQNLCFSSQ